MLKHRSYVLFFKKTRSMNAFKNSCFLSLVACLLLITDTVKAQDLTFGEWRTYLPYTNPVAVAVAADRVYAGTRTAMFSYSPLDFSIETYTRAEGFSGQDIAALAYSTVHDVLVVAYQNADIDLVKNGRAINISDVFRATILGDKSINTIHINGDLAYLACGFGIVVLDIVKEEIKDTYIIGAEGSAMNIYQVAVDDEWIVAATAEGLLRASVANPNLSNVNNWEQMTNGVGTVDALGVVSIFGRFYANVQDQLYVLGGDTWSSVYQDGNWKIKSMDVSQNQLVMAQWEESNTGSVTNKRVTVMSEGENFQNIFNSLLIRPVQALIDDEGVMWVADRAAKGLIRIAANEDAQMIAPDGPRTNRVWDIKADGDQLYVAPGGVDASWGYRWLSDGYFVYENGSWDNVHRSSIEDLTAVWDILYIKPHPSQDKLYLASYLSGLVEVVGEDYTVYDFNNSSLMGTIGDEARTRVSGIEFDAAQNLWIANFGSPTPISVLTAGGEWKSFIPTAAIGDERGLYEMIVDDYDQKWMIVKRNGILVFNHGADIMDTSDDQYKHLKSGEGNGNLQTNGVNCFTKDQDGAIWVGTDEGVAVYYCPFAIFDGGCEAVRPFVEVDGFGAFLLESEVVRTITVDGANRKWIGTENGVWLMSPDGTDQIEYFNTSNSPLLSNTINDIEVNDKTGEVFIGTDMGIISYKSTATVGGKTHSEEVLVYPNPVRPDYDGLIAIKGLAQNADVKITDISGTLVYETTALGGQAIWNGKDYNGRKASSGVYLIFSASEDGQDTNVAKLLIVN